MLGGVERWANDGPLALRDRSDIVNGLHGGIVLAVIEAGIAGSGAGRFAAGRQFFVRTSTS